MSHSDGISIRPALRDDAPAIAHVQVNTWKTAYRGIVADDFLEAHSVDARAQRWRELFDQSEHVAFVAVDDSGEAVGFSNGGANRNPENGYEGEVYGLYILPEYQGRGLGRELVTTFVKWFLQQGWSTMVIWTLARNPARRFYEHLGGTLVDERQIEIGSQLLKEIAFGWEDIARLAE